MRRGPAHSGRSGTAPGDEARTQRFRAAPNYYRYLLGLWAVKTAAVFIVLVTMEMGAIVELFKAPQQKLPGALVVGLPQIIVLFFSSAGSFLSRSLGSISRNAGTS